MPGDRAGADAANTALRTPRTTRCRTNRGALPKHRSFLGFSPKDVQSGSYFNEVLGPRTAQGLTTANPTVSPIARLAASRRDCREAESVGFRRPPLGQKIGNLQCNVRRIIRGDHDQAILRGADPQFSALAADAASCTRGRSSVVGTPADRRAEAFEICDTGAEGAALEVGINAWPGVARLRRRGLRHFEPTRKIGVLSRNRRRANSGVGSGMGCFLAARRIRYRLRRGHARAARE